MVALVTGASSGIGRDMTIELARKKYDVIIVARRKEELEKLKKEVEEKYKVKVDVRVLDLTDREGCIKLHDEVLKKYGSIDVLINNAGFGACGKFTETDMKKEIDMIDTNITALHILTKLFMQDMVKVNKGHIMNVASIAGFMPGPLMATYYSTKAYVVRLTQALRQELFMRRSKVKICALCPGPVNTNFFNVADVKFHIWKENSKFVAKYGIAMMLANRNIIFPSIAMFIFRLFAKILPDQFMAFFCYFMQRKKLKEEKAK